MMTVRFYTVFRAEVAQLVEHTPEKRGVGSSILPLGTIPSFSLGGETRIMVPCFFVFFRGLFFRSLRVAYRRYMVQ